MPWFRKLERLLLNSVNLMLALKAAGRLYGMWK
jgi:hypothetical protein